MIDLVYCMWRVGVWGYVDDDQVGGGCYIYGDFFITMIVIVL